MKAVTPFLVGGFFVFSAVMVTLVAITLLAPGTPIDAIWSFKPDDLRTLRAIGSWLGFVFIGLALAFAIAAYGAFLRKPWGRGLAIAIFAISGASDAARMLTGAWVEGLLGVVLTCVILGWLATPNVRAVFRN